MATTEFTGTPGPWVAKQTIEDGYSHEIWDTRISDEKRSLIAMVGLAWDNGQDKNAKLISKAPELVDILTKIIFQLKSTTSGYIPHSLVEKGRILINEINDTKI